MGLAVGMACCILILLWVQDEFSFDRFHKNYDNLYTTDPELDGAIYFSNVLTKTLISHLLLEYRAYKSTEVNSDYPISVVAVCVLFDTPSRTNYSYIQSGLIMDRS